MTAKHTLGEWRWEGNALYGPNGETVLEVRDMPEHALPEMQSGSLFMENEEGDKPVLAASSVLLEACQIALDYSTIPAARFIEKHGQMNKRDVLDKLIAAIAKAEGDSVGA